MYLWKSTFVALEAVAKKYEVRALGLAAYLLEEHSSVLTVHSVIVAVERYAKDRGARDMVQLRIPDEIQIMIKQLSASYEMSMIDAASFIIDDNLPAVEGYPEAFPWVQAHAAEADPRTGELRSVEHPSVFVPNEMFLWLQHYCSEVNNRLREQREKLSMRRLVMDIFAGIPAADFYDEEFLKGLRGYYRLHPKKGRGKYISISPDLGAFLRDVAATENIPMWALSSYVLQRERLGCDIKLSKDVVAKESDMALLTRHLRELNPEA